MQAFRTLPTLALAAALALGLAACQAPNSAQNTNTDQSASAGDAVNDTWITTKVKSELATTKGVESTNISVTTVDGKVTLTGVLPNDIAVKKAIAAAQSVKGVKDVDASGLKANG